MRKYRTLAETETRAALYLAAGFVPERSQRRARAGTKRRAGGKPAASYARIAAAVSAATRAQYLGLFKVARGA